MPITQLRTSGRPVSAGNLSEDFGTGKAGLAVQGVHAIYDAVTGAGCQEARDAFLHWKSLFGAVCGYNLDDTSGKLTALAKLYRLSGFDIKPPELLFSLHTYYAIVVRTLTQRVVFRDAAIWPDLFEADLFSWYTAAGTSPIEKFLGHLTDRLDAYSMEVWFETNSGDLFKPLYQRLLPGRFRHALGEYYTPDWLAEHVMDELGYDGDPEKRLLDPACGSGTFLVLAIRRIRKWYCQHRQQVDYGEPGLVRKILSNVIGFDLNPLAVLAARANYLIAICDLIGDVAAAEIPVYLCDSIGSAPPPIDKVDFVAGNPPWLVWDHLRRESRDATKPLWEHYGLFTLSPSAARHGGGKKDLSMLMLYSSADRYLREHGRLGFVITQTLFQTKGAGEGFRRFQIGRDGAWLGVLRVDDLTGFQPFEGASNWTATIVLEKGRQTEWPVAYFKWSLNDDLPGSDDSNWRCRFNITRYCAQPIDPDKRTSPWMISPSSMKAGLRATIGRSDYEAHLGANTGGANGVYWVRILERSAKGVVIQNLVEHSKARLDSVTQVIEPDLLYPLVRWSDVRRFHASPSAYLLLAQDPQSRTGLDVSTMQRFPQTLTYLARFEQLLRQRAAYRRYLGNAPFYSMYDVAAYTVAPTKVVWRGMDRQINCAVLEPFDDPHLGRRPVIPQETCVLIEAGSSREAHYICAVLNSAPVSSLVCSHSVNGGKSFGTPSMLDYIPLKRYEPADPQHVRLSTLSVEAHCLAAFGEDYTTLVAAIDEAVGEMWDLPGDPRLEP